MNIIIMGPQGSGKSTQAELLSQKFSLPHIETGQIYRNISREPTALGIRIKFFLDRGELIDDETTFLVVDQNLAKLKSGFILDGFPRTLVQAKRELFPIDKVIYIKLLDEGAKKRLLLRQRQDDTENLILERLRLYHKQTEPVLDYYRRQGKLVEIDGSGTIEKVAKLIWDAVKHD